MADDEEIDIELRTPADVATRCIILASLVRRLAIESLAHDRQDDGLADEAFDLRAWLQTEGLWKSLTDTEAAFMERPLGGLTDDEMATVAWQSEGLAALGWALGLADLPPVGDLSRVEGILEAVPSPWDQTGPWLARAVLQPELEIARERDRAELIEWRVGVEAPRREVNSQDLLEYDQAIADVAREAAVAGLAATSMGDLVVAGATIASLPDERLERLAALAEERLRALNWLCGFGDSWDRVPLDV